MGNRDVAMRRAAGHLRVSLGDIQETHRLTNLEMLKIIAEWLNTDLKYAVRAERGPDEAEATEAP